MNWYRITFSVDGKRDKPIELPAHDLYDAVASAAVKRGLYDLDGSDGLKVVEADCIEEPEHVAVEREAKMRARESAHEFTTALEEDLAREMRRAL